MERTVRQYLPAAKRRLLIGLADALRRRPGGFREQRRGAAQLPSDADIRDAARRGSRPCRRKYTARCAQARWKAPATRSSSVSAPSRKRRGPSPTACAKRSIDRLETLQENTRSAQQELAWLSAALIPGTLVLVGLFLLLVGRPMRQIDRAIRELGEGDFGRPITVSGPHDIEILGRQLEWLRHRLKESTDEKNKFLRHMSHELKTPLANIREGTELLLDGSVGQLDIQQQEVTGILRDNGVKLQKLIENLLTFSAWQTHTAALELSEFELKPMVFSVLEPASPRAVEQEDQAAARDQRDQRAGRRGQAQARAREPLVERHQVHAERRHDQYRCAACTVTISSSTSATMARACIPMTATGSSRRFTKARRPQGGPVGGTGIGLSVVAECVQAHGGSVRSRARRARGRPFPSATAAAARRGQTTAGVANA